MSVVKQEQSGWIKSEHEAWDTWLNILKSQDNHGYRHFEEPLYLEPHARNEAKLCEKDRSLSYVVATVE